MNIIKTILYIIAYIFLFYELFGIKKLNKKLNGVVSLVITFEIILWLNAILAGIINLIRIPVSLLSMSVLYFLLAIVLYFVSKGKEKQFYEWHLVDFMIIFLIILTAVMLGIKQHGNTMQIAYLTSDPALHMEYALEIMESGSLNGKMFFAPLNNGLFISLLSPFFAAEWYYKVFILADIIMFALAGSVFYSVVRTEAHTGKQACFAGIMALIYMLGYPLNNKLFGFVYLGMSVTILMVIIYILQLYYSHEMNDGLSVVLLMLGCNAIVNCYMLFAPVVYFAILFVVIARYKSKIFSWKAVSQCLGIFLLPCILAIYYCYFNFFVYKNVSVSEAIAAGGGIYAEVYSNFAFFIPFVIYAIIKWMRQRKHIALIIMIICFTLFMLGMLAMVFKGTGSFYYFYKIHHPMWMLVCWITAFGVMKLFKEQWEICFSYLVMVIGLFACMRMGINNKIVEKEAQMGYFVRSNTFFNAGFDVYEYNRLNLNINLKYNPLKLKLFYYVKHNLQNNGEITPVLIDINGYADCIWYEDITRMKENEYYVWESSEEDVVTRIFEEKKPEYLLVLYDSPMYEKYKKRIKEYDVVYKNKAGRIVRISE